MLYAVAATPPTVSLPIVIGVAGGSGSGKTTVVRRILESLGGDQVTVLEHDRYYRDRNDLRLEERAALNYDHPGPAGTSRFRPTTSPCTPASRKPRPRARARPSSSRASSSTPTRRCAS
jgi:ABC-type dipeptide/oligopeptide/nickel transport system ATPase component